MNTLDQLRTWNDRNAEDMTYDQAEQAGNDAFERDVVAPRMHVALPDNRTAVQRIVDLGHDDSRGITDRQRGMIGNLLDQLDRLDPEGAPAARAWTIRNIDTLTPGRDGTGSAWIGRLIGRIRAIKAGTIVVNTEVDAPTVEAPARKFDRYDDIPAGYYAYADAEGVIKFFRVTHKDGTGQYAGRHFVNVDACASDERHPIKVWNTRQTVLNTIREKGPRACMELYGQELGHCGRCHRELTDALSRSRGIGPDCWGKM